MDNFKEFLENLMAPRKECLLDHFKVSEENKIDHDIEDIDEFKKIYERALKNEQYIVKEEKALELKVGVKIVNAQGVNRYFISLINIKKYLHNASLARHAQISARFKEIIKDYTEDGTGVKDLYFFPHPTELRVIIVTNDESIPKNSDEKIHAFYFENYNWWEGIGLIREEEWGKLELPEGWGGYENAIKYKE
jgi:hypothetical protein